MRPTLALQALAAVTAPHKGGHRCTDNNWYHDGVGTQTPCPVTAHLVTVREQIDRLHTQVHEAAHDTPTMVHVMEAMTGFDAEEMDDELRSAWVLSVRQAVEALAEYLDRDPAQDARLAAVRARLAAAQP